jgi:hypothetical protein
MAGEELTSYLFPSKIDKFLWHFSSKDEPVRAMQGERVPTSWGEALPKLQRQRKDRVYQPW